MKRIISTMIAIVLLLGCLTACGTNQHETLNVAALKGPTGMGLAYVMDEGKYQVELLDAPDVVTGKFINGEIDIAAVPINLASVLYNKTNGEAVMIGINTLGVLYILENGETIQELADLSGKKIYATGQGSTPQFILEYLLKECGLEGTVEIEYIAEHASLAAMSASGEVDIVMLPEPNVSAVLSKNHAMRIALDLTEEWKNIADSMLLQGCYIVRRSVLDENPKAVERFLDDVAASVAKVNRNSDSAALIAELGIVASQEIASRALPNCNIVCITGDEMQVAANAMYEVLFEANPKSIGGAIPNENHYVSFGS